MRRRTRPTVICATAINAVLLGCLTLATVAHAQMSSLPVNKCLAAKIQRVGKSLANRTTCLSTEAAKGVDDAGCPQKASDKFTGGNDVSKGVFAKLDTKYPLSGPTPCLTFGDQAPFDIALTDYAASILVATGSAPGKCDAAKIKCVGKYVATVTTCTAKAAGKLGTIDAGCTGKAGVKLADGDKGCLDKAAAKGDCTNLDTQSVVLQGAADTFIRDAVCRLVPGHCPQCTAATDCPGTDTECKTRTCAGSACGFSFASAGTLTSGQSTGDCRQNQCNGAGAIVPAADDADVPVDGNQCTADVCTAGVPSHSNQPLNAACNQNGGTACDGLGACVVPSDTTPQVTWSGDMTFHESNLPAGTAPNAAALTSVGEIQVIAPDGLSAVTVFGVTIGGAGVVYPVDVDTPLGRLTVGGFSGDATGGVFSFSYTLEKNVYVFGVSSQEILPVVLTDVDGTSASNAIAVVIVDDAPLLHVVNSIARNTTDTTRANTVADMGADSLGAHTVVAVAVMPPGLSSQTVPLTYGTSADGSVVTARAGVDTVFTLTGLTDGSYQYHQVALLDLNVLPTDLQSTVGAGGPQPAYYLYTNGQFGSTENSADWLLEITASGNVTPSTQGMGVDNNLFEETTTRHETMHFELDDEGASTVGGNTPNLVYIVKIGVVGFDVGEMLNYVAYYTDGTYSSVTTLTSTDLSGGTFLVRAPAGKYLDSIDLDAGPTMTSVRFTSLSAYVADGAATKLLGFNVTATDGDDDSVSGSLQITVSNGP